MTFRRVSGLLVLCGALSASPSFGQAQFSGLGTLEFANSGAPGAQAPFLAGLKYLHSFEFDDAAESFREAQKADPDFAMAYWGEAMSYNHPLWAEQDLAAARKVLSKLGETKAARAAKAKTERERDYLAAVETLFGEGDKLVRDIAYSEAMAAIYEKYPTDHEAGALYALSLLGTVRPGDKGYRRQILAASIAQKVFEANPNHPGAAHFLIHAYDDPEHAPLGLAAADAYAKIAPAAGHANHMPSHIYVQRGMWEKVAASNQAAFKSSQEWVKRKGLSRSREDFHSLSWLHYSYLQMGQPSKASEAIDIVSVVAKESPTPRVTSAAESMKARQIIETEKWEKIALPTAPATEQARTDGTNRTYDTSTSTLLAAGISAAKLGDLPAARQAVTMLEAAREKQESEGRTYNAKSVAIMEKEVEALVQLAEKNTDQAVALMKEATSIESSLDPPSGPPEPIKPSHELFGEILLELNQPKAAVAQFEESLLRMPNRRLSVQGLTKARSKASSGTTAGQ